MALVNTKYKRWNELVHVYYHNTQKLIEVGDEVMLGESRFYVNKHFINFVNSMCFLSASLFIREIKLINKVTQK